MEIALDVARLADLIDDVGDLAFVQETVGVYLAELPGRRDAIVAAAENGDLGRLRNEAHSLGSASAMIGAAELLTICRRIEGIQSADDTADLSAMMADWPAVCARAEAALTRWLRTDG